MRNINKIAKDLIHIEFNKNTSFHDAEKKFFAIMRKYKIKRGTKLEDGGVIQDNFEWTMCRELFINRVADYFMTSNIFNKIPKDLEY